MIRNLKVMGLALVAMLAMSALGASAASAQFESELKETKLTAVAPPATQEFQITPGGTTVKCSALTLDNAVQKGVESEGNFVSTEVTVEPTYGECAPILGQAVTIDTNECKYVFHLADNATTGTTDIECPNATGIQITVGSVCTYEVNDQTGLGTVHYSNTGSKTTRTIDIKPEVTGITSTRTTNHFFCPGATHNPEGIYKGEVEVTGSNPATSEHVGIWVD